MREFLFYSSAVFASGMICDIVRVSKIIRRLYGNRKSKMCGKNQGRKSVQEPGSGKI
jgi:hypothetical protein